MSDIDLKYNDETVCPYCKAVGSDSWELASGGDGKTGTIECGECNREFGYEVHVDVTYSTWEVE